jgi:hypothetical protein
MTPIWLQVRHVLARMSACVGCIIMTPLCQQMPLLKQPVAPRAVQVTVSHCVCYSFMTPHWQLLLVIN